MKGLRKASTVAGAFVFAGMLGYCYIFILKQPMRLIVENERNETMGDVVLSVGPHKFELGELEPGQRKEKWFFYEGSDSSYHLEGITQLKKTVHSNFGYVTHGMGFERIFMEFKNDGTIYFRDLKRTKG